METKNYAVKDDAMLIKAKVAIRNAKEEIATLSGYQPDITVENLSAFETDVDNAMAGLLAMDKNGTLKKATVNIKGLTKTAFEKTRLLRTLIESNFKEDKDALLEHLAYPKYYRELGRGKHEAAISLLSAITRAETELKEKFATKSLPVTLIDDLVLLSNEIVEAETTQEHLKGSSKPVTEQQRKTLNDIYIRVMDICKLGQVLFAKDAVKKDKFIFTKLAGGM